MNMQDVLRYPLGPLPWSLATPDGKLAKTTKAALLPLLESTVEPLNDVPEATMLIVDGMAMLQSLKTIPKTFGELASYIFQLLKLTSSHQHTRIDLIMDQYPDISIKNPERTKRASGGTLQVKIQGSSQKCPTQWKKFLSDGSNKTNLVAFLVNEWQQTDYAPLFVDFGPLYVTHGEECHKLTGGEKGVA